MSETAVHGDPVPVTGTRWSRAGGWWGMVLLIATEATLFVLLIASYFYLRVETGGPWPPAPLPDPALLEPLLVNLLLVASCLPVALARRDMRAGRLGRVRAWVGLAAVAGFAFLVLQVVLVRDSLTTFRPQDNGYGSIYYTLIGVHFVHAAAGSLGLVWVLLRSARFTTRSHLTLVVVSMYWYFVTAAAVAVFLTLYLAPRG